MNEDQYAELYSNLNWDAPDGPIRCTECAELGLPRTGAYPTSMSHFEDVLCPISLPQTSARPLLIFLDPRPSENNFRAANPLKRVSMLGESEHRYFCLTPIAWRSLALDQMTSSVDPMWPTPDTAPMFLRRYLTPCGGSWSYDGFLAYFLYLFQVEDALITNLAKCHFGESKQRSAYKQCAKMHLSEESAILRPNLLFSFTSLLDETFLITNVPGLARIPKLSLLHPAARVSSNAKRDRFIREVENQNQRLSSLGLHVEALLKRWVDDVDAAIQM